MSASDYRSLPPADKGESGSQATATTTGRRPGKQMETNGVRLHFCGAPQPEPPGLGESWQRL